MKIDRKRPLHWLYLVLFFLQCVLALMARRLWRAKSARSVVMYGHKLNGNLLALHNSMTSSDGEQLYPTFLTMDPSYVRELKNSGVQVTWACGMRTAKLLAGASAVISDHGLHSMQPLLHALQRTGLRFFDVWHGIPYKGFDAHDFRLQHKYDETWVASELNRELYVRKFGFAPARVVATGYARTDRLVRAGQESQWCRASLGLPIEGKLVMFAPTWKQDSSGRSLFPFGCDEHEFLGALAETAARHGAGIVLRTHLNSERVDVAGYPNIHALPASRYPDAEAALLACDALVCDWSSIAFDFLLLDRPAIFLDVEPPFRKGFSLGPEYRYGSVTDSLETMVGELGKVLAKPDAYWHVNAARHHGIKQAVYGGLADGKASERCIRRLARFFPKNQDDGMTGT